MLNQWFSFKIWKKGKKMKIIENIHEVGMVKVERVMLKTNNK